MIKGYLLHGGSTRGLLHFLVHQKDIVYHLSWLRYNLINNQKFNVAYLQTKKIQSKMQRQKCSVETYSTPPPPLLKVKIVFLYACHLFKLHNKVVQCFTGVSSQRNDTKAFHE